MTDQPTPPAPDRATVVLRIILATVLGAIVLAAAWLGFVYSNSPEPIRHPHQAHYHFRLQVIVNGTPVNFAEAKYQTPFNKDICTAALTKEPIHFHDGVDQFVHIHWDHLTGGILLKDYGWNFIGGPSSTLGYKFNGFALPLRVAIHGQALPKPPAVTHYYVYTGNQDSYRERKWSDFLNEDLRDFFAGKSRTSFLDRFVPTASAHGDDEELAQLNDVLGSVVIFAQPTKPSDSQVKDRFNHLIPLPTSSCSG
jgi:hypothetical protein